MSSLVNDITGLWKDLGLILPLRVVTDISTILDDALRLSAVLAAESLVSCCHFGDIGTTHP